MSKTRSSVAREPECAFYYPGQYWRDPNWAKNLILFFDGIAMLIPEYMDDHGTLDDHAIISGLREHGLFHIMRPEDEIGVHETRALKDAVTGVLSSGKLDQLIGEDRNSWRRSSFGSLSMSRLGYYGDESLADSIVQDLKDRGLATDSEDGASIPMHGAVRALILVLLSQILRSRGTEMGMTLSPMTDQVALVDALNEIITGQNTASPSMGDVISFDMAMVGVDLGVYPMDEILDFRRQNYSKHREYCLSARRFARDLSQMPPQERQVEFEQRQEELEEAARNLRKLHRNAWRKPISIGLSLTGAAWTLVSGDPIGAAVAGAGALFGATSGRSAEVGAYSYLYSAKGRFY